MSRRELMDDRSLGSDDTPAASNVRFDVGTTYDVSLDDDELVPYGSLQLSGATEEDRTSQSRNQDLDDTISSTGLHSLRITGNAEGDDGGGFYESFASDDTSAYALIRHDTGELNVPGLTAILESEDKAEEPMPAHEQLLLAENASPSKALSTDSTALFHLPNAASPSPDQPGEGYYHVEQTSASHGSGSCALVPSTSPDMSDDEVTYDNDQPSESSFSNLASLAPYTDQLAVHKLEVPEALVSDLILHQPYETAITLNEQQSSDLVVADSDNHVVPINRTASVPSRSKEEIKVEPTDEVPVSKNEDDYSISLSDVFGAQSVSRPQAKPSPSESLAGDDDNSTINTHGESYWTSKRDQSISTRVSTIDEGNEEDTGDGDEEAAIPSKSYHSRTSYRSRSSASSRSIGVVLRAASSRRRDEYCEVEVSLDGFMHQNRQIEDQSLNLNPFTDVKLEEKKSKLSRSYKLSTLCAVLCLLSTMIFFAIHIGPFEVKPEVKESSSSSLTNSADQKDPISTVAPQAPSTAAVPTWMANTFASWKSNFMGKNLEVPFMWTQEKSGSDMVIESFSKCLGKVVAGDGLRYDTQNKNAPHFKSKTCKVLNTNGHLYINVDLFSTTGITRAAILRLTQNRVSDVVLTPFLMEASTKLFPPKSSSVVFPEVLGRLLVMFRDPIERSLNRYEMTRLLTGNDSLTLAEYSTNPVYSENNPLTRGLLGLGPHDTIGDVERNAAQESINQHVFIGLFDEMEESINRFELFFQWTVGGKSQDQNKECVKKIELEFERGYKIGSNYALSDPAGYNLLVASHTIDSQLYNFAKSQFIAQGEFLMELKAA